MSELSIRPNRRTKTFLKRLLNKQNQRCYYCQVMIFKKPVVISGKRQQATIDHYVPRSKGGPDIPSNFVAACWPCNQRKDNIMPEDFIKMIQEEKADGC